MLAGCSTTPNFSAIDVGNYNDGSQVKIRDVVDHIKCEIYRAAVDNEQLRQGDYYVGALLNLQVNDSGGLAPSVNFIEPFNLVPGAQSATQSLTWALSLQYNSNRFRTYSQSFIFHIKAMFAHPDKPQDADELTANEKIVRCAGAKQEAGGQGLSINGINLTGDLGLHELVGLGLSSINYAEDQATPGDYVVFPAGMSTGYVTSAAAGTPAAATPTFKCPDGQERIECQPPVFGSTEQFAVARGVGGGPNWTFLRFKGPVASSGGSGGGGGGGSGGAGGGGASGGSGSGGSGGPSGLVSASRTDTHTLYIAFVPTSSILPLEQSATYASEKEFLLQYAPLFGTKNGTPERDMRFKADKAQVEQELAPLRKAAPVKGQPDSARAAATAQSVINSMILQNLQF